MTLNITKPKKSTHSTTNVNLVEHFHNGLVHVEKVFYGKVIMFRTNCPKCEETLFEPNLDFKCDVCSHQFQGIVTSLRTEVDRPRRKKPSPKIQEQILDQQGSKCYWCYREFDTLYFRYDSISILSINWDHVIPYAYSYSNADENFVAACSVCNSFKSSKNFENDEKCKDYLKQRWDKHLRLRKIVFLEEEFI